MTFFFVWNLTKILNCLLLTTWSNVCTLFPIHVIFFKTIILNLFKYLNIVGTWDNALIMIKILNLFKYYAESMYPLFLDWSNLTRCASIGL